MHPVVAHITSGFSFFTGTGLILSGIAFRTRARNRAGKACGFVLVVLGLMLAALSGSPVSLTLLVMLTCLTISTCSERMNRVFPRLVPLTTVCWVVVAIVELPWFFHPAAPSDIVAQQGPVVVLADSMTAGLGEGEATTWPTLLNNRYPGPVIDLSHVGETFASSAKRIQNHRLPANAIVIIELGGNDMLGATTVEEFEHDIEILLTSVTGQNRQIFMFELPLLPFHNRWGQIQRESAGRYDVHLIPKHTLISVIGEKSATFDSIHLTQEGHERMLQIICELLGLPA